MVVLGSVMMSVGITICLKAELGVDPSTAFISGLSNLIGISYGTTSQIWMGILIIVVFFLEKNRLGIGTVLNALVIGWFIDFFLSLKIFNPKNITSQLLILLMGVIIMPVGIAVYISGNLGEGATEAIMIILHYHAKIDLKWVKIALDILLLIFGKLLGTQLGLGTILGVIFTGLIVEKIVDFIHKINWLQN